MYLEFYGLREQPFELTANPRFLFLTSRQREALSTLPSGLMSAKSLTLLVGEAGSGKTTLLQAALASERCAGVRCVYLNNPTLTSADFVATLAHRFELGADAGRSKPVFLERLDAELRRHREAGEITALVVDEAQSLSTELLEEIRLLANIESADEKLLPLVLAGQPELANRLERPELRQLKQRVALRCELLPFELGDTAAYIASRIKTAGGVPAAIFTQEAVTLIHECASGIPRSINVICDNALLTAMALGRHRVERALVAEVCRDLRLAPMLASMPLEAPPSSTSDESALSSHDEQPIEAETSSPTLTSGEGTDPRPRIDFRWRATTSPVQVPARIVTE